MPLRRLTAADQDASHGLSREAFGASPPTELPFPMPGSMPWGVETGGRAVAKATGRRYDSWFHGRQVPTLGIGGVVVAPEHRGAGLVGELLERTWQDGREWGAAVSTLFPSAPGIYRPFGYEVITDLADVEVPTRALAGRAAGPREMRKTARMGTLEVPYSAVPGARLRRAEPGDLDAVMSCYDVWARLRNGPLTRRGPSFPVEPEQWLAEITGVTLALDEDDLVVGFCSWSRGAPGREGVIEVPDLVWSDPAARDALVGALASSGSVAQTIRLRTSGALETDLVSRGALPQVLDRSPYMLRILDVVSAFEHLTPARQLAGALTFEVVGDSYGGTDGTYHLEVGDGRARCIRGTGDAPTRLTPRGLALLWSGALPLRSVVAAGLATCAHGPEPLWDALGLHRPLAVLDYF